MFLSILSGTASIFFISLVDAFFVSAFFLYGMLVFGSAAALYGGGYVTPFNLFLGAYLGSTLGSTLNFYAGRWFSHTRIVQRFTVNQSTARVQRFLDQGGLFYTILLGKFLGVTRPVYGVVLGALQADPHRFLIYEWIIGAIWTFFWVIVLVFGKEAFDVLLKFF